MKKNLKMDVKHAYCYINQFPNTNINPIFYVPEERWVEKPERFTFDLIKENRLENDSETLPALFNLPPVTVSYQYVGAFTGDVCNNLQ